MAQITNISGISLPLAVWLAADGYDFFPKGKSISATALLKPVRQILLRERLSPEARQTPDVSDFIASRLGHTIHDGIEKAWTHDYASSLRKLGYPSSLIERIRVNPGDLEEDEIPIWLEQRGSRKIMEYTLSGKFDMVLEGTLQDFKSTSVYSWMLGSKDEDYKLQGSIYRWIHQDKITEDHINIQFIFTDWSRAQAKQNPKYPQQRVLEHRVELMSLSETEAWIKTKLRHLEASAELPEESLPECTDAELWRSPPVYKYFSDPSKISGRATKNFADINEANRFCAEKGKGIVITVTGKVKACAYCPAFPICTQKDNYEHA